MTDTFHDAAGTLDDAEALDTRPGDASSPTGDPGGPALDFAALRAGGRDASGKFARGHLVNVRHGLRIAPDNPLVRAAFEDCRQAIEVDLGDGLATLKAAAVREAARLTIIVDSLGENLIASGILSAKGNQRAALSAYVMTLDRLHRLMTLLGLERRAKPAAQRIEDYIGSAE